MWRLREPRFDVASAVSQGKRNYQEDSLVTDFPLGTDFGFAVLADGMGGHAAGDVASKIVVTEVFSELKFQSGDVSKVEENIAGILREAALSANECVKGHVAGNPSTRGMGATLVAPVFVENRLFWISIGDSPLFLFRKGVLTQLNEDHSMAPQIDFMVQSGLMDEEAGRNHPDRNCLTSVLYGEKVPKIDCPEEPVELAAGDILIVASDGLQFLSNEKIRRILAKNRRRKSSEISEILLSEIERLGDPDQDNVAFSVIKINHTERFQNQKEVELSSEDDVVENLFLTNDEDENAENAAFETVEARAAGFGQTSFAPNRGL